MRSRAGTATAAEPRTSPSRGRAQRGALPADARGSEPLLAAPRLRAPPAGGRPN